MKLMSRTDVHMNLTPLTDSGIKFEGCSVVRLSRKDGKILFRSKGDFDG